MRWLHAAVGSRMRTSKPASCRRRMPSCKGDAGRLRQELQRLHGELLAHRRQLGACAAPPPHQLSGPASPMTMACYRASACGHPRHTLTATDSACCLQAPPGSMDWPTLTQVAAHKRAFIKLTH